MHETKLLFIHWKKYEIRQLLIRWCRKKGWFWSGCSSCLKNPRL